MEYYHFSNRYIFNTSAIRKRNHLLQALGGSEFLEKNALIICKIYIDTWLSPGLVLYLETKTKHICVLYVHTTNSSSEIQILANIKLFLSKLVSRQVYPSLLLITFPFSAKRSSTDLRCQICPPLHHPKLCFSWTFLFSSYAFIFWDSSAHSYRFSATIFALSVSIC